MELSELFVSHKQVDPVVFLPQMFPEDKPLYLNTDRVKKVIGGDDTSDWKVEDNTDPSFSTQGWKVKSTHTTPEVNNQNVSQNVSQNTDYAARLRSFIIGEEGFRERAYKDGKYYSIGYGFNGPQYKEGDIMTREEAEAELTRQLQTREDRYKKRFGNKWDNLTDNQRIALLSYGYNTGDNNIINGNIAKYLDAGDLTKVRDSLSINTFKGAYHKGLDARRKRERELFDS